MIIVVSMRLVMIMEEMRSAYRCLLRKPQEKTYVKMGDSIEMGLAVVVLAVVGWVIWLRTGANGRFL
jgi:hypothetical protein